MSGYELGDNLPIASLNYTKNTSPMHSKPESPGVSKCYALLRLGYYIVYTLKIDQSDLLSRRHWLRCVTESVLWLVA